MNGTALPSEDLFNHACRFRLRLLEQKFGFQTSGEVSRIRKANERIYEARDHSNAGGGGFDFCCVEIAPETRARGMFRKL
jgi:hypothetical protein